MVLQLQERLNSGKNESSDFKTAFAGAHLQDPRSGGNALLRPRQEQSVVHIQSTLPSLETSIRAQLPGNC